MFGLSLDTLAHVAGNGGLISAEKVQSRQFASEVGDGGVGGVQVSQVSGQLMANVSKDTNRVGASVGHETLFALQLGKMYSSASV